MSEEHNATSRNVLYDRLMDPRIPKSESEWYSARKINDLEEVISNLQDQYCEIIMVLTEDQLIELSGGIEKYKEEVGRIRELMLKILEEHKNKKLLEDKGHE